MRDAAVSRDFSEAGVPLQRRRPIPFLIYLYVRLLYLINMIPSKGVEILFILLHTSKSILPPYVRLHNITDLPPVEVVNVKQRVRATLISNTADKRRLIYLKWTVGIVAADFSPRRFHRKPDPYRPFFRSSSSGRYVRRYNRGHLTLQLRVAETLPPAPP